MGYVTQQIQQFHLQGERFAMQHLGTEYELSKVLRNIVRTMTPEERLAGLSPEEMLAGLSPEQREQMLVLLQKEQQKKPKRGKKS